MFYLDLIPHLDQLDKLELDHQNIEYFQKEDYFVNHVKKVVLRIIFYQF
jgi:hypothetical protein